MENQEEIWKDVIGYEGLYQVSNLGRVKSKSRLRKFSLRNGYYSVTMSLNSHVKIQYVHRLVASSFIGNFDSKPMINHKDGNRLNNNASNLEWCTSSENNQHSYDKLGRIGGMKGKYGIGFNAVIRTDEHGYEKEYLSATSAELDGFCRKQISSVCTGRQKTHKGYHWRFKNKIEK
jgi:hypothetical protein